jgi:acetyl-CoA carboxylase carboxyltransferase component
VSYAANYTLLVDKDLYLTAKFINTQLTLYTDVDPPGAGVVTGGGTFECGETATVSATDNPCFQFLG